MNINRKVVWTVELLKCILHASMKEIIILSVAVILHACVSLATQAFVEVLLPSFNRPMLVSQEAFVIFNSPYLHRFEHGLNFHCCCRPR